MATGMVGSFDELYMGQLKSLADKGDMRAHYALEHADSIAFWLYEFGNTNKLRGVVLLRDKSKSPDDPINQYWIEFHNNRN